MNIVDLKINYKGHICLIDYDCLPDDDFCLKVYALCKIVYIAKMREFMNKTPKKYRIFFIDGGASPV